MEKKITLTYWNKKSLIFLALAVFFLIITITVSAIDWQTSSTFLGYRDLARVTGTDEAGNWTFYIERFPKTLGTAGGREDAYDMDESEGLQFYVEDMVDRERVIFEVYTSRTTLWDRGSFFVIEPRSDSIYGHFPLQKFIVQDSSGFNFARDTWLPFYFPSEDYKIFQLDIEIDTSAYNELKIRKIQLVNSGQFLRDLACLQRGEKVPLSGADSSGACNADSADAGDADAGDADAGDADAGDADSDEPSVGTGTLVLSRGTFEVHNPEDITVSFDSTAVLTEGFKIYVSNEQVGTRQNIVDALTAFNKNTLEGNAIEVYAEDYLVSNNFSVTQILSDSVLSEKLADYLDGRYMVIVYSAEMPLFGAFIDVTRGVASEVPDAVDTWVIVE